MAYSIMQSTQRKNWDDYQKDLKTYGLERVMDIEFHLFIGNKTKEGMIKFLQIALEKKNHSRLNNDELVIFDSIHNLILNKQDIYRPVQTIAQFCTEEVPELRYHRDLQLIAEPSQQKAHTDGMTPLEEGNFLTNLVDWQVRIDDEFQRLTQFDRSEYISNVYKQVNIIDCEPMLCAFLNIGPIGAFIEKLKQFDAIVAMRPSGCYGQADFLIKTAENEELFTLVEIELQIYFYTQKGKQTVVQFFNTCRQERKTCSHYICQAFRQMYGYIRGNQLKYGLLSTYETSFICQVVEGVEGGQLLVSQPIDKDHFLRALFILIAWGRSEFNAATNNNDDNDNDETTNEFSKDIEDDDPSYETSESERSPTAVRPNPTLPDINRTQGRQHASKIKMRLFYPLQVVGTGRTGSVLKGMFHGQLAAFKIADVSKNRHLLDELRKEAAYYDKLRLIELDCVPKLLFSGYYDDISYCNVWQLIDGKHVRFSEMTQLQFNQALLALKCLHSKRLCHNDIRESNLIFTNDSCYIIDFGCSKIATNDDQLDEEVSLLMSELKGSNNKHYINLNNISTSSSLSASFSSAEKPSL